MAKEHRAVSQEALHAVVKGDGHAANGESYNGSPKIREVPKNEPLECPYAGRSRGSCVTG